MTAKPAPAAGRGVTLAEIHAAMGRIRDTIYLSPCARSEDFSQHAGNSVYLKLDNLQRTGAFKERGALNKLLTLTEVERSRGVIAASAGNHAQGLAYHAGRHGIRAQIVMPLTTPLIKVSATKGYGAEVVLHGANYDEACEEAVRRAGEKTLPLIQKYVDDIVTVDEEEIANAVLLLLEREKTLAEGAGAAAFAALINHKTSLSGKKVAVLVCGGNIDVSLLSRIMERGLVKDGRLVRLRVHLPDYPGALHRLTGILAQHRANIVETSYDRAYYGVNLGDTAIDITMETRGPDHIVELLSALSASGYVHERIL
jgi:threonine dehydratase